MTIAPLQPMDAPKGSEQLFVRVAAVKVEGSLAGMAQATDRLVQPLEHTTVSAAQIFELAQKLEQAYAQQGYVLARVIVPQQDIVDNADVRLVVVDGYLQDIDTSSLPQTIQARVSGLLAPLKGKRGLTLAVIERKLMLASDTPGVSLRSTLTPGTEAGASLLVIEARYRATSRFLSLDNSLSKPLGRYQAGGGIDLNSAFGLGEKIYARAFGDLFDGAKGFGGALPRNRAFNFGGLIPLGSDGLTLTLDVTNARATPQAEPGQLPFTSDFHRSSLRLRYPFVRTRALTLGAELALDAEQEQLDVVAGNLVPISLDRLRVVRTSGDIDWSLAEGSALSAQVTASFGLSGLGARTAIDATPLLPLSRQGADAKFQKLELTADYRRALAQNLVLELKAHAQTGFGQALSRIEQIGFTGSDCLSTSESGSLQGDSGACARAELQAPMGIALKRHGLSITPYLFAAYADVQLAEPTALEYADIRASVVGLGLKFAGASASRLSGAGLNFEFGHEVRSDGPSAPDRLRVSTWYQF